MIQIISILVAVFALKEELFIISHLNDKGALKCLLQPLGEKEGNQVTKMHSTRGWSSTGIQIERLSGLEAVTYLGKIAMTEEDVPAQETVKVWHSAPSDGETFQSSEKLWFN